MQGYAPSADVDPDSGIMTTSDDPIAIYIFFFYFSSTIITSTGFGDVAPVEIHTEMLTNLEMLLGMIYHAGVFGFALNHFMILQRRKQVQIQEEKRRLLAEAELARAHLRVALRDDSIVRESDYIFGGSASLLGAEIAAGADFAHISDDICDTGGSTESQYESPPESPRYLSSIYHTRLSPATQPRRVLLSGPTTPAVDSTRVDRPLSDDDGAEDDPLGYGPLGVMIESNMKSSASPLPTRVDRTPAPTPPPPATDTPPELTVTSLPESTINNLPAIHRSSATHPAPSTTIMARFRFWRRLKRHPKFEKARKIVIDFLFIFELLLQILSSSLMFVLDRPFTGLQSSESDYGAKIGVLVLASFLLFIQLGLNASVSIRLLNKITGGSFKEVLNERGEVVERIAKEGVTSSFLAQSYVSTVLVYSSLYFFLFAFTSTHEFSIAKELDTSVIEMWFTHIYFSCVVMTGTGSQNKTKHTGRSDHLRKHIDSHASTVVFLCHICVYRFGDVYARGVMSRLSVSHSCCVPMRSRIILRWCASY